MILYLSPLLAPDVLTHLVSAASWEKRLSLFVIDSLCLDC